MRDYDELLAEEYAVYEKPDMSETDRLGLAYCRLNSWLWDDIAGECPKDFYSLPRYRNLGKSRKAYIEKPISEIRAKLGKENCSKYWWLYSLGKTEEAWREWYYGERLKEARRSKVFLIVARTLWFILVGGAAVLWLMRLTQC